MYYAVLFLDKPCEVMDITGVTTVNKKSVTITFSTNDSAIEFQCKLDNEELSLCKLVNVITSNQLQIYM